MRSRWLVALFVGMVVASDMLAPRPAAAISGGHPATGQDYGFVRFLRIRWPDGRAGGCTGSLIGERRILTAAHCVLTEDGQPAAGIEVRTRKNAGRANPATATFVHAGYERRVADGDLLFLKNDLAILELRDAASGPYGLTPFDYIAQKQTLPAFSNSTARIGQESQLRDARSLLDDLLSRDESGHPYAVQVGFGLFGCDRQTQACSRTGSNKAKYIEKYIYNFRADRAIVGSWCDPSPFSLAAPGLNLICSDDKATGTVSPLLKGPAGIYGAQPGDSGGPAIVFDKSRRPFIIGTMSFGNMSRAVNQNLVDQFDFLHDTKVGSGTSYRKYEFAP